MGGGGGEKAGDMGLYPGESASASSEVAARLVGWGFESAAAVEAVAVELTEDA